MLTSGRRMALILKGEACPCYSGGAACDVARACRQFERGFLSSRDPSEPPDDRKTFADMARYHRQVQTPSEGRGRLVGTFVYDHDNKTSWFERVGEEVIGN